MMQTSPLARDGFVSEPNALSLVAQLQISQLPTAISTTPGNLVTSLVAPITTTAAASALAARTELACLFGLIVIVIALRTRLTICRAARALHHPANAWLLLHIAISFFEVGRLQWRGLAGLPVHSTLLDLVLGLAHCLSSWQVLFRRARVGYRDLIPLGLRVQPFLFRLVTTVLAFRRGSADLHHANIRLGFDSFLYARLLIFACTKVTPFVWGPRTLHTTAAVLGGFLATHNSGIRGGSAAYVFCSAVSIALDRRTGRFMAGLSRAHDRTNHDDDSHTTLTPTAKLSSEYQRYVKLMLYVKGITHTVQATASSPSPSTLIRPMRIRAFSEVGTRISHVS